MKSSLEIPKHWTFRSRAVAKHFTRHVRERCLVRPGHQCRRPLRPALHPCGGVVCTTSGLQRGTSAEVLQETLDQRQARFTAIEESREMAERYDGPPELVCGGRGDVRLPAL
ncbi:MAG: hypothetical protein M5U12_38335 [Verrucomicrobia bacterium]|nr:hypothetical protein [Verrucomicrobiota bacterium]